jgi:hypothetical protein
MTLDEYLDYLEEYWDIFGPIPPAPAYIEYKDVRL